MNGFRSLGALLVACAIGCSGASSDDQADDDGAAITHAEAAKAYEYSELLLDGVDASPAVQKLGANRWSVYSASKGRFIGIVMFAIDANKDVKYAVLVNAGRAADGKAKMAVLALDKAGNESTGVPVADAKTLMSDSPMLNALLAKRTAATPTSASGDCVVGVARLAFTLLAGAAIVPIGIYGGAALSVAVEFSGAFQAIPALGAAAGTTIQVGSFAMNVATIFEVGATVFDEALLKKLARCAE